MVKHRNVRRSREIEVTYERVLKKANCRLTREEEQRLCVLKDQGCREAFDKLVESQLRWVVKIAHRYLHHGVELDDLIQMGNMGLIRAVRSFDARFSRLSTFSGNMINNFMKAGISSTCRTIRVPGYRQFKSQPVPMTIKNSGPLPPATQAIIEKGVPYLTDHQSSVVPSKCNPFEDVATADQFRHVWQHVEKLSRRERDMLMRRMRGETLVEIGRRFNITKERVRQIQERALLQLREALVRADDPSSDPSPNA